VGVGVGRWRAQNSAIAFSLSSSIEKDLSIGAVGSHESNIMRYCIFHYRIEDIMSRLTSRHDIFNPIMKDTISYYSREPIAYLSQAHVQIFV
jgi:hypothetical protein